VAVFSVVVGIAAFILMITVWGLSAALAGPWAVVVGQVAGVGAVALSIAASPLSVRYLRRYANDPPAYRALAVADEVVDELSQRVEHRTLRYVATAVPTKCDPTSGELAGGFDLLRSPGSEVTLAVGRSGNTTSVLTFLDDGRLVVTTSHGIPPNTALVIQWEKDAEIEELLDAHVQLLQTLVERGATPVPSGTSIFGLLMSAEWRSFGQLGAIVGSFLDLTGKAPSWGLRVAVYPPRSWDEVAPSEVPAATQAAIHDALSVS
jgi:hypothetical protein